MASCDDLERGRSFYEEREWAEALASLSRAEERAPLAADDLERLAWSAALTGLDDVFLAALERLHQAYLETGSAARAARAAFWLGFRLFALGEPGRAGGWLGRAGRLIEGTDEPCAERGYLLLPSVYRNLGAGENAAARSQAAEAAGIGERCGDRDLVAVARNLQGRALVREGRIETGLALLDDAMLAVTSGELSPIVTGIVYCNAIATCQQIHALDRAREWAAALSRWCENQPQLVTFTGNCRVHRSEVVLLAGRWGEAFAQLTEVCGDPRSGTDAEVLGDAFYQRAEIHRLRGEFDDAQADYRRANEHGREPQPGLSLLRLAQGRSADAASSIRRVLSTTTATWQRAQLLPAFVEIALAIGAVDEARESCDELECIARDRGTAILGAIAAHARGAVHVVEGDHHGAIAPLRHALDTWHRIDAPYVTARIRVLLARACAALGDDDSAELELDAARRIFEHLGATPDLAGLESPDRRSARAAGHDLSPRELEVLRLLARGLSNRAIAGTLGVSERTVHRHVSNIFAKTGVASRAAATAFAYDHQLV